jgi:hypothetical protein
MGRVTGPFQELSMSVSAEQALESQIQAKGLTTAPRVTPAAIDAMIKTTELIKIEPSIMLCVLTLHNGLTVVGKNLGSISPENYDEELAKQLAMRDARDQLWPLAGFMLAEDIHRGNRPLTQEQRELPDHVQRVITEMYQVAARLMGLSEFLVKLDAGVLDWMDLSIEEIADLREQHGLMKDYVAVLQRRLSRAGV